MLRVLLEMDTGGLEFVNVDASVFVHVLTDFCLRPTRVETEASVLWPEQQNAVSSLASREPSWMPNRTSEGTEDVLSRIC